MRSVRHVMLILLTVTEHLCFVPFCCKPIRLLFIVKLDVDEQVHFTLFTQKFKYMKFKYTVQDTNATRELTALCRPFSCISRLR